MMSEPEPRAKFGYSNLLASEEETLSFISFHPSEFDTSFPQVIDTCLKLIYYAGTGSGLSGPDLDYHTYCWYQYAQLPHSLRSFILLYERGYYLELSFILRYLLEVLVKMKYLTKHKDFTARIVTWSKIKIPSSQGKTKVLTVRDMFDEVSPGLYEFTYGRVLSGFQHGSLSTILLRTHKNGQLRLGASYDQMNVQIMINMLVAISLGWLTQFPRSFPQGLESFDEEMRAQYERSRSWLKMAVRSHKEQNPKSSVWYKAIDPLIEGD